jgi:LPS export ABC transporter protein LptC
MMSRVVLFIALVFCLVVTVSFAKEQAPPEPEQQINDFSLSGFGEKGKKDWDLSGKSADVVGNSIQLKDITGNLYGEQEHVSMTADKGNFDRQEGKVHLEQNVIVKSSTGATLTTDSLDWDRRKQIVVAENSVNLTKDNIVTTATGALGEPNLNKVTLQRDVQVDIVLKEEEGKRAREKNRILITSDGPLEIDYAKSIATFQNNVKVETQDNIIYSDIMQLYFTSSGATKPSETNNPLGGMDSKITKIVALGNVKIVKGENLSYCDKAVYTAADNKIILTGTPKFIIYSTEGLNASFGN